MEDTNFLFQILSLLILLVISIFTYLLSRKIKKPYTVLLVFVGILLIPISNIQVFDFLNNFTLSPNILFYIFLPILLFEAAYNINIKSLSQSWVSISSLSVLGVFISSFFIGGVLYYIFNLAGLNIHFLVTLLFGAIISATDPVAVISIFKSMGAPKRLSLIVEGESLFNDGTSVALFSVVLGIILSYSTIGTVDYLSGIMIFTSMIFGGIIFGLVSGFLFSKLLGYLNYNEEVEISLTLISTYITFSLASLFTYLVPNIPISSIIATVISAIVIGNYGRYKITPKSESHMTKFLSFFTFLSNSIVFILMGMILFSVDIKFSTLIGPLLITVIIVMLSRAISVYFSIKWINFFHIEKKINDDWQKLLFWGGLRGIIALMMVLMIPGIGDIGYENILLFQDVIGWNFNYNIKDFLLFLTVGIIIFTTFINATTVSYLMKKMGINRLHNYEKVEYEEWKIIANLKVIKKLEKFYKDNYLSKKEYDTIKFKYKKDLKDTLEILNNSLNGSKKNVDSFIKKFLFKYSLGIEKQYLNKFFYNKKLDEKHYKFILNDIDSNIAKMDIGLSNYNNNGKLKKNLIREIRQGSGLIDKISFLKTNYSINDMYIINRTKYELIKKIMKDLKKIPSVELGFNQIIIKDLYRYYETHLQLYKTKMKYLFENNTEKITALESNIMEKYFLKLEEKLLKDLYKKEIIPHKFYIELVENIQKGLYQNLRKNYK